MSVKPRKFRRMMLTGHRVRVFREAKGHAVPDRSFKRHLHMEKYMWRTYPWTHNLSRGAHPEQKPKEKK